MNEHPEFDADELADLAERLIQQRSVEHDAAIDYCSRFEAWVEGQLELGLMEERTADALRADIWFVLGRLAYVDGDVDAALDLVHRSIAAAERAGRTERRILGLRAIARIYEYMGLQAESTRFIFEAIDLADQLGDPRVSGLTMLGLASLYEAQGAYEQTLDTTLKAYDLAVESGDEALLWNTCAVVGLAHGYLGRNDEALDWLDRGLAEVDHVQTPEHALFIIVYRMFVLGQIGRLDEAIALAEANLDGIENLAAQHAAATFVDVAELYLRRGDLDRAENMLHRAERAASDERMKGHRIRHSQMAADLYEAKGEPTKALEMMREHARVSDELRGRNAQMRLVAVERHFATELAAKNAEIDQLRTIELVDKNDQLDALNRQKGEILRVVAHDLHSPLAAITMLTEIALLDHGDEADAELSDQLNAIRTASAEMSDTIDQLLHLREDAPRRPRVSVDVVTAKSLSWASPLADERSILLEQEISAIELEVEEALLRRALDDALWVMLQSAGEGDRVRVIAESTDNEAASITVVGPVALNDRAERSLYIGRRLVERLGGSLTIERSEGSHERQTASPTTIRIHLQPSVDLRSDPLVDQSPADQPSVTQP